MSLGLKTRKPTFFIIFAGLCFSFLSPGAENLDRATIRLEVKSKARGIQGLFFKSVETKVTTQEFSDGQLKAITTLEFRFSRKNWDILLSDGRRIQQNTSPSSARDAMYYLPIIFNGPIEKIELMALSSKGIIERQNVFIEFTNLDKFLKQRKVSGTEEASQHWFQFGLDHTSTSYKESNISEFRQQSAQFRLMLNYAFSESKWFLEIANSFSVLPYSSNLDGIKTRMLDISVIAGFNLGNKIGLESPWKMNLLGGFYYSNMLTTNDRFGYKNLMGPEISPELKYSASQRDELSIRLRLALAGSNFGLEKFSNRNLALQLGLKHVFQEVGPFSLILEITNLKMIIENSEVKLNNKSLGIRYYIQ